MSDKKDGSQVYNILAFSLSGEKAADNMVKEIKSSGALDGFKIEAECVVEQDAKGKVHIHEPGKGGVGAAVGAAAGGLLGLLGGPVGLLAMTAGGAVMGGAAGHYFGRPISKGDLEDIGKDLTPDSSAFLLLLEDTYSEKVIDSLSGYDANVVTLTVGDELTQEIAQYSAGDVTTPDDK